MKTVLLTILVCIGSAVSAQNVLDSIQLYDFPVKEGVIYKYEYKNNPMQTCASNLCIVSVVTHNDSVYHFESGKVAGVFTIDDAYAIVIENAKNEYITYSNLQEVTLKKGDRVNKGMCIGTTAEGGEDVPGMNQVDILVLRKVKQLPYRKTIEYIRSKSTPKRIYYSSL